MLVQTPTLDFNSVAKGVNHPSPTSSGDLANKGYVDSLVEGLAWKDSVRAASTGNVTVSSPGTTIDGITLAASDRVLLKNQTTASENGIYVFATSSSALVRSLDANAAAELEQATVGVEEGTTNGDTTWRQTAVNFTLGSGSVTWESFGTSIPDATTSVKGKSQLATSAEVATGTDANKVITPAALAGASTTLHKVTATIGDGSATQIDVDITTINTKEVTYSVRDASTDAMIICDAKPTSATNFRLNFAVAPSSSGIKVVVIG